MNYGIRQKCQGLGHFDGSAYRRPGHLVRNSIGGVRPAIFADEQADISKVDL
jgi:hypothetical protein